MRPRRGEIGSCAQWLAVLRRCKSFIPWTEPSNCRNASCPGFRATATRVRCGSETRQWISGSSTFTARCCMRCTRRCAAACPRRRMARLSVASYSSILSRSGASLTKVSGRCVGGHDTSRIPRSWLGSRSTAPPIWRPPSAAQRSLNAGAGTPMKFAQRSASAASTRSLAASFSIMGPSQLDASLLQIPLVGFLPPDHPHVRGTLAAIERRLMHR